MQTPAWQQALKDAFTDLDELLVYLELSNSELNLPRKSLDNFSLRVPKGFAALINKGDPSDPLLLQILPSRLESNPRPGFSANPVGDLEAQAAPGVLHKYQGRALIMATGACAVHCRYCFRRHYPYAGSTATPNQWHQILQYLQEDSSIHEAILSGGDPLMLEDEKLAVWFTQLASIPHLQRLRLHTRLPVVLPERITPQLIDLLNKSPLQSVVVFHINHPRELSDPVIAAIQRLKTGNITLLNQSVLLKGINDSLEVLRSLSEGLFAAGILPYYLHLLDRVDGAAHFEVSETRARRLYRQMLDRLPGYLVPKLVREIAGEGSKSPLRIS